MSVFVTVNQLLRSLRERQAHRLPTTLSDYGLADIGLLRTDVCDAPSDRSFIEQPATLGSTCHWRTYESRFRQSQSIACS